MFNITSKIYNHIINTIKKDGSINTLLFDTETTGIIDPQITQIGYILLNITLNEENQLIYKEILRKEINFQV